MLEPITNGALAVIRYVLLEKWSPVGLGQGLTGVMSTETVALPGALNAQGRNPITTCPSLVNAELASLTPLITLMSAWPGWGGPVAGGAAGGGQTKLEGRGGVHPSEKPGP